MTPDLRRPPSSPATGPLDNDDLLCEILLRLPPQPSSLPRASAVCKIWRRLVTDAGFFRRFRLHHRRNPPLLGFVNRYYGLHFQPTLEAPNRIPDKRFSLERDHTDLPISLGCRHGLVLLYIPRRLQVLVWDPVTSEQHSIALPPWISAKKTLINTANGAVMINGAVLRAVGDIHFQVVMVIADGDENRRRAFACVYSSQTSKWGNLISTPIPSESRVYQKNSSPTVVCLESAVLIGDSLYWLLVGYYSGILEFDLGRQRLAVIQAPVHTFKEDNVTIIRAVCGGLGFLLLKYFRFQLWNRKNDCNGAASWVPGRTIELVKLLCLEKRGIPWVMGFAEYNNVVFMWTINGIFMIHLESLQFNNTGTNPNPLSACQPFESVYAAGNTMSLHSGYMFQ
ncbi:unnamed protein product [Alopecurus aequalis]